MSRLTLSRLFLGIALFAIALALLPSQKERAISYVEFSPDGTRLAAVRRGGREESVSTTGHSSSLERTVSVLATPSLRIEETVKQHLRRRKVGAAFSLFQRASGSSPSSPAVSTGHRNGLALWDAASPRRLNPHHDYFFETLLIVFTNDQRLVAIAGVDGITLWNVADGSQAPPGLVRM